MRSSLSRSTLRAALIASALCGTCLGGPAMAQDAAAAAAAPAAQTAAPSPDAMTNLIRLLVAKGTLTQADGDALLAQAQSEAAAARAAVPPPPPPVPEGAVRVARVPEAVRQQIRDEIRQDVMAQAASEGWVTKNQAAPDWTRKVRVFGDVRVRTQSELYARTNSDQIIDIGSLVERGPVDLSRLANYDFLNTRQDRINRLRMRVRLGFEAEVSKGVVAGIKLGTGDDNSPISENVSLGGGFAKRNFWLDAAYIKLQPKSWANLTFGRFETPFNNTELLYDNDLRFDGVAAKLTLGGKESAFSLTGGAFPIDFGNPAYPGNSTTKLDYPSKWLFAGELAWKGDVTDGLKLWGSVGYHSFQNVQGKLSDPCNMDLGNFCSTDGLVPLSLRKGNTVFTMRNHVANSTGIFPQVFGLKFGYDILDVNLGARIAVDDHVGARLSGNYIRNLGFKRGDICSGLFDSASAFLVEPYNNYGTDGNADRHVCTKTNPTSFVGGNTAWMANAGLGYDRVDKRGSWRVWAEYRYVQSDALLDAFTDSDFHLGGTNAKGYVLGGEYGVRDGLSIGARWLSSNEISGEAFAIDVLQVDLQARF
ncbi:putative porin [Novosphingobium cyanobacteriorum]|uniref:Porin n=1 Tax=Novosphingobium cyanobacteriorum TaxID=3024215 RepID=A0ABT6CMT0_9SPHN|nr:putative porin [Novosphingobium cyanobacteriorum]MDF8334380.1 putative porin [Novosphingobium cyanobacteriorum]